MFQVIISGFCLWSCLSRHYSLFSWVRPKKCWHNTLKLVFCNSSYSSFIYVVLPKHETKIWFKNQKLFLEKYSTTLQLRSFTDCIPERSYWRVYFVVTGSRFQCHGPSNVSRRGSSLKYRNKSVFSLLMRFWLLVLRVYLTAVKTPAEILCCNKADGMFWMHYLLFYRPQVPERLLIKKHYCLFHSY